MNNRRKMVIALGAGALVSVVAFVAGCTTLQVGAIPAVPENLRIPATEVLSLVTQATGVQIYECSGSKDEPTRFEWIFKAPEAELFDGAGNKVGRHYVGPTWELNDGSKVVGEVKARDNGPDASAIPWLLLSVKSTSGTGVLSQTRSIQRVNTVGGTAPTDVCNQAQAGKVTRVGYKAMYNFYVAKP
jgi:hypothetical protein